MKPEHPAAAAVHQRGSLEAARIIAADPERYGGPDAGLVAWAQRVLATAALDEPDQRRKAPG